MTRFRAAYLACIVANVAVAAHAADPAPAAAPAAEQTFIQAGRLLADPATGKVETNKTIVVENGKIVRIADGFEGGAGKVVDLKDSFVLPGLIDSHVHLTAENGPTAELDAVKKTSSDMLVDGVVFAGRTLRAGFTTVADLGGDTDALFALRDGIATGRLDGPRIIAAGFVGAHGGHGDIHGYRPEIIAMFAYKGLCSGADDCRRAVRQQVQRGADIIKIASTGGVMSNTAAGVGKQMFDDELVAIVETAHGLGRQVACHAHGTEGINAAVRAGVDSIEHGTYTDAESLKMMKAKGTYLVPTILAGDTVRKLAETVSWMPANVKAKALQVGPNMVASAKRAREAGILIAFGTDSGVSKHGENAREFALMVQAGFTPLDAIRTATVGGAAHLKLSDQIGSLSAGKAADIIAVKADPLADVRALEQVSFVMKGGKVARDSGDPVTPAK